MSARRAPKVHSKSLELVLIIATIQMQDVPDVRDGLSVCDTVMQCDLTLNMTKIAQ